MAEEGKSANQAAASESAKKKGGKLPVIIALALMLGAGGFFGMKMRAPKTVKEPEIKLGAIEKLDEFLVNLQDGGSYLRVAIAIQLKDGIKGEEFKEKMPIIQDAIIDTLTSKTLSQIRTLDGKRALRRQIAKAINTGIEKTESTKEKGESDSDKKEEDKKSEKDSEPKHPDWDSDTGPVLKVYFTSFATQ
jgi:flagellar FliL protein